MFLRGETKVPVHKPSYGQWFQIPAMAKCLRSGYIQVWGGCSPLCKASETNVVGAEAGTEDLEKEEW